MDKSLSSGLDTWFPITYSQVMFEQLHMGAWSGYWFNIKNPHPFPCELFCCSFPFNRMNPISIICNRNETFKLQNSQVREKEHGARAARWWELVRLLACHQCGPGSKPIIDAICGSSLLLRGFSLGTLVFSPLKNQHFQIPIWPCRRRITMWMYIL